MLVLSRKASQSIVIGGRITVTVVAIRGGQVRLGIEAPDEVRVLRQELIRPAACRRSDNLPTASVRGPEVPGRD